MKHGFHGEIITTPASRQLVKPVLPDSAHLSEEEVAKPSYRAQLAFPGERTRRQPRPRSNAYPTCSRSAAETS
jgi:hypothetical protein